MRLRLVRLTLAAAGIGIALGTPGTLTAQSEQAARARREQALSLARQINLAEMASKRFGGGYMPLERLSNVGPVPAGFALNLVTDGRSYVFTLKDADESKGYAIVSDDAGVVYEAFATRGGGLVPIGTR
jgi:hypothetical protein